MFKLMVKKISSILRSKFLIWTCDATKFRVVMKELYSYCLIRLYQSCSHMTLGKNRFFAHFIFCILLQSLFRNKRINSIEESNNTAIIGL